MAPTPPILDPQPARERISVDGHAVDLYPGEDGMVCALAVDVPGCFSQGDDRELAIRMMSEALAVSVPLTDADALREHVVRLKRSLGHQRDNNAKRNRQLDLLGMVWCDGGCENGMARYDDREVSAADVALLVVNAERARRWYISRAGKQGATADERERLWAEARAEIEAALPPAYRAK